MSPTTSSAIDAALMTTTVTNRVTVEEGKSVIFFVPLISWWTITFIIPVSLLQAEAMSKLWDIYCYITVLFTQSKAHPRKTSISQLASFVSKYHRYPFEFWVEESPSSLINSWYFSTISSHRSASNLPLALTQILPFSACALERCEPPMPCPGLGWCHPPVPSSGLAWWEPPVPCWHLRCCKGFARFTCPGRHVLFMLRNSFFLVSWLLPPTFLTSRMLSSPGYISLSSF